MISEHRSGVIPGHCIVCPPPKNISVLFIIRSTSSVYQKMQCCLGPIILPGLEPGLGTCTLTLLLSFSSLIIHIYVCLSFLFGIQLLEQSEFFNTGLVVDAKNSRGESQSPHSDRDAEACYRRPI